MSEPIEPVTIEIAGRDPVEMRSLTSADADAWVTFAQTHFGAMPYIGTFPDEVATVEETRSRLARLDHAKGDLWCGFFVQGQLLGDIGLHSGNRRKTAHVVTLAMSMAPDLQGLGVGAASFGRVITWARSHALIEKIELGVLEPNHAAVRLYERFGFEREGMRRGHIRQSDGTTLDEIMMAISVS